MNNQTGTNINKNTTNYDEKGFVPKIKKKDL